MYSNFYSNLYFGLVSMLYLIYRYKHSIREHFCGCLHVFLGTVSTVLKALLDSIFIIYITIHIMFHHAAVPQQPFKSSFAASARWFTWGFLAAVHDSDIAKPQLDILITGSLDILTICFVKADEAALRATWWICKSEEGGSGVIASKPLSLGVE